jgi:hypothetical protein
VPIVAQHGMAIRDPVMARMLSEAVTESVTLGCRRKYDSVTEKYAVFTENRGFEPFPVDQVLVGSWILELCTSIQVSSLKMHLAGIKSSQLLLTSVPWPLDGNELINKVMRFVKRRLGGSDPAPTTYPIFMAGCYLLIPYVH